MSRGGVPFGWTSLREAAAFIGMSPEAFRKQCERKQFLAADGVVEAAFDGVRARKFANRWRVSFGEGWTAEGVVPSNGQAGDGNGRGDPQP